MSNQVKIKVTDLIGKRICISVEDAQKLFSKVEQLIKDEKQITISFKDITIITACFLNIAIGQLYGSFSEDIVRSQLKVEGLSPDDMGLLKRVVDNAKKHYLRKGKNEEQLQKGETK